MPQQKGWQLPEPDKFMDDYNRNSFLSNFPPDLRWERVEGLLFQEGSTPEDSLVGIGGRDHRGEEVRFWTNLPNAMYLMNLLYQIQRQLNADVPSSPSPCKPHSEERIQFVIKRRAF